MTITSAKFEPSSDGEGETIVYVVLTQDHDQEIDDYDYTVQGVFTTEELAEEYLDTCWKPNTLVWSEVRAFPLDKHGW